MPVPQAPPQAQPQAPQVQAGTEASPTLNFDFNNIPDVKMPVDPGWRPFVIKKAPTLKTVTSGEHAGKTNFIAQFHVNDPNARDNDETLLFMKDVNARQDQFDIKQLYYACGIDPVAGITTAVLVNRPFQGRIEQSNGKFPDGSPRVFSNLREFLVDQRFIRNIPKPAQPAPPVGTAPPQVQPMQVTPPQAPAPPQAYVQPTHPAPVPQGPPVQQPVYSPPPPQAPPTQFALPVQQAYAPPPQVQYAPQTPPLPNPPPIPGA